MTAECADRDAMIRQLRAEVSQGGLAREQGQGAMRVPGIVAGAQFNRPNFVLGKLAQDVFKRQATQEWGKYSNSHSLGQGFFAKLRTTTDFGDGIILVRVESPGDGKYVRSKFFDFGESVVESMQKHFRAGTRRERIVHAILA